MVVKSWWGYGRSIVRSSCAVLVSVAIGLSAVAQADELETVVAESGTSESGTSESGASSISAAAQDSSDGGEFSGFDLAALAREEQFAGGGQFAGNGGQDEGSPLLAGWDRGQGFFIRDADNNFLLKIGGRVQVRYTYKGRDRRGDNENVGEIGGEDDSFFELERARIKLAGHVLTPKLTYAVQVDGDTDGSGLVDVVDYLVEYKQSDALRFGVGQHKAYFLRQEPTSSSRQQFVDRSLANEVFNIDRTLGIWVRGHLAESFIYYVFEVGNGFDSVNRRSNAVDQIPHFAAKLDFNLIGANATKRAYSEGDFKRDTLFVLGFSFASDQNNDSSGVNAVQYTAYQLGVDTVFKSGGLSFVGEYMGRFLDFEGGNSTAPGAQNSTSSTYSHGFYAQAGMFFTDHLEAAARVSAVWGNDGSGRDGTAVEVGPGLNWYISGDHKVKWQTDLLWFDIPASMPFQTTRLAGSAPLGRFSSSAAQLQAGEQGILLRTQLQLQF